ncbi:putative pantoate-beta-alanine ligase [Clostridium sp. CAG:440]|nr:putative pantoate-beta-alanine ligase [Clostridium sp. CAG:440]
MSAVIWNSLKEAKEGLNKLHKEGKTIGSIHTLGALHIGHGKLIEMSSKENDCTVISIYPNIAQLAPGSKYEYDIEKDCKFAEEHGATHIICPKTEEIYPEDFRTYLDQGECYKRLNGTAQPYLFKGMITMSVRWILFTRPTRTYWGLKDIGQTILVERALKDLFQDDIIVREVPCVRYKSGIAISSRLMNQPENKIKEFRRLNEACEKARKALLNGETNANKIKDIIRNEITREPLKYFSIEYIKVAKPLDFTEPEEITLPIIFHVDLTDGKKMYFDGLFIRNEEELKNGPPVIWLDEEYPPFLKEE